MSWLQLQILSDPDSAPLLEALLEAAGAVSVTMVDAADQPLYEPPPGETPLWQAVRVTGLFTADTNAGDVIARLRRDFLPRPLPPVAVEALEERDWQRAWMEDFKPMRFGKRLWICPSWCPIPDPGAVNLLLDPGLAFGTGTHPTTALCLEWLDGAALAGKTFIDYGCGSGILGIAALLLGAGKVLAVDNDPQAIDATRENCRKNGIEPGRCETFLPEAFAERMAASPLEADGVLANILAEPLIGLASRFAELVIPGGDLLLSGILARQAEEVAEAYRPWFAIQDIAQREEWVRIAATRLPR